MGGSPAFYRTMLTELKSSKHKFNQPERCFVVEDELGHIFGPHADHVQKDRFAVGTDDQKMPSPNRHGPRSTWLMASWWSTILSDRLADCSTCEPSLPIAHIIVIELNMLHAANPIKNILRTSPILWN